MSKLTKIIKFITGNRHKVKEARGIFKKFGIQLEHEDLGYPEIQGSLEDVARFGAQYASSKLKGPVIVEDAGLFIRALNWFPGTYSSFVQETITNKGILKLMNDVNDRYAEFRSVVGYCTPKSEPEVFLGTVSGHIAYKECGSHGFAYDPLFIPEGFDKTFGELTRSEKNEFSHRRRSLEEFALWLNLKGDLCEKSI